MASRSHTEFLRIQLQTRSCARKGAFSVASASIRVGPKASQSAKSIKFTWRTTRFRQRLRLLASFTDFISGLDGPNCVVGR